MYFFEFPIKWWKDNYQPGQGNTFEGEFVKTWKYFVAISVLCRHRHHRSGATVQTSHKLQASHKEFEPVLSRIMILTRIRIRILFVESTFNEYEYE